MCGTSAQFNPFGNRGSRLKSDENMMVTVGNKVVSDWKQGKKLLGSISVIIIGKSWLGN